jgi:serine/threonine protein kinase
MTLVSGTKLGPYEIQSPIGAGAMGEVYQALDTRLGRIVAIKILPESFSSDPDRLRRFEQEARAVAALNHPNILAIHDIGEQQDIHYIVSEFLEGRSLRQELSSSSLPVRRVADYGAEIARGLAAAHEKRVVHRDLKPENIFITKEGRVKILDFGIAKLAALENTPSEGDTLEAAPHQTIPGMVLGTVGYMSPEQVRGEAADARSDIFALGVILYEMVSGKRAFRRETSAETMTAILNEDPPDLSGSTRPLPPNLERVIRRCLEKKPLQRFQSARDLAFDLEGVTGTTTAVSTALAQTPKWKKWLVLTFAAALLFILASTAGWLRARGASPGIPVYSAQTFERGFIYTARFGPDSRTIYYSASWSGSPVQLYAKDPASPESRPLNLTNSTLFAASTAELAISLGCNDRYIGHCQGTLALAPISGGAPREIAENVLAADWTSDNSQMAVLRALRGRYQIEFPLGKTIYESTHPLGYLRLSPNGKSIAFAEFVTADGDGGKVVVIDAAGKEILRSHDPYNSLEGIAWSPSTQEVWVAGTFDQGWADAVYGLSLYGKERIVLRLPGMLRLHDVSRDGHILLTRERWRDEIQFRGPGDTQERNLSWLDYATVEDLAQDGTLVSIEDWGEASGAASLGFIRKTDASPAIKLGKWASPVFSADAKRILALDGSAVSNLQLTLLPTGSGETQKLKINGMSQILPAGWMADGKQVYFPADDGHGWRMYLYDIATDHYRAVTPVVSVKPSRLEVHTVSRDGQYIFARDLSGTGQLYPLGGGEAKPLKGWQTADIWVSWSTDGKTVFVYQDQKTTASLFSIDVNTGKRTVVRSVSVSDTAGVTAIVNMRVTPDLKAYAYSYNRELSELYLVEGIR